MQAVAYRIYRHTVNESIRQSDKFIILGTDEWNTIHLIQLLMFYVHSVLKSLIGKFRKLFARVYDCGFMKTNDILKRAHLASFKNRIILPPC